MTTTLLFALALLNLAPLLYMVGLGGWGESGPGLAAGLGGPWVWLWSSGPNFGRWMANSAVVAIVTVTFHLLADSMAGFVLAKRRFRGRGLAFVLILLAMMVPRQVTLIPLFLRMARWGLADTMAGLILPGLGDVVGVFLMRQFFLSLPDTLLEAARVDGAGAWGTFRHVAVPLARPAMAVLGVLAFQHYWSDFFWPLVIVQSPSKMTVQVGLAFLAQSEFGPQLPLMAAGATAAALPVVAVFMSARGALFQGLRAGALKG